MADAVPVSKKVRAAAEPPKVTVHGTFKDAKDRKEAEERLLAQAKEIVASEVPDIPDDLVNTLGQEKNYGKFKEVSELPYKVFDEVTGKPTGETRVAIRINH